MLTHFIFLDKAIIVIYWGIYNVWVVVAYLTRKTQKKQNVNITTIASFLYFMWSSTILILGRLCSFKDA